jgi:hypothetical protein
LGVSIFSLIFQQNQPERVDYANELWYNNSEGRMGDVPTVPQGEAPENQQGHVCAWFAVQVQAVQARKHREYCSA